MLEALHNELIDYLGETLPGVTVEAYTSEFLDRRTTPLPGCVVSLPAFDPDTEFGNCRDISKVLLSWEVRVLVDQTRARSVFEVEAFATVVWWALRRWTPQTANVGPLNMKRAGEDVFRPDPRGYLVWLVEAEQEAYFDFAPEDILPVIASIIATDNFGNTTDVK